MRRKPGTLVPLEAAILCAAIDLRDAGATEFHGYRLAKHVANVSDRKRLTAYGTLYRALGRLEDIGLLQSHWEDPQIAADENRPGRRLYELSSEGIAAAEACRRDVLAAKAPARRRRKVAHA